MGVAAKLNTEQVFILWTKGAGDISDLQERGLRNVKRDSLSVNC